MNIEQDWVNPKVGVKDSPISGKGIFADANIKRGEKIIVWGGGYTNSIGAEEARKKGKLVMQWDDDLYSIEDSGNDNGYFVNHSCDPNVWLLDAYTLSTKRDVEAGEELTADYATWEANENYLSKWNCKCHSPLCRAKVTGKDWRDPILQERYKEHFSPLLNKRIQRSKK